MNRKYDNAVLLALDRQGLTSKQIAARLGFGSASGICKALQRARGAAQDASRPACDGGTLCWWCRHAIPSPDGRKGCPWSRQGAPVAGWTAEATVVRSRFWNGKETVLKPVPSFRVERCPQFEEG